MAKENSIDYEDYPVGTKEWRKGHLQAGDNAMKQAYDTRISVEAQDLMVRLAVAHYTAANTRYRPESPRMSGLHD